jgi:hypothetical protein
MNGNHILIAVLRKIIASRTVYNGSDKLVLDKKIIDDFNSLGVWFSTQ